MGLLPVAGFVISPLLRSKWYVDERDAGARVPVHIDRAARDGEPLSDARRGPNGTPGREATATP